MTANDLLTVGFADEWFRVINARVEALVARVTPAAGEVVLFSAADLAERLNVDVSAVRKWLATGKRTADGTGTLKLQAFYFNSEPRIPWPAAVAYGRGEAFDLATLPSPTAPPPRKAALPVARPTMPHSEPINLRIAS